MTKKKTAKKTASEAINATQANCVIGAIAEFQRVFPGIERLRENTHTQSRYAKYDDVVKVAKPYWEACGLTIMHQIRRLSEPTEAQLLVTSVMHLASETCTSSELLLRVDETAQQDGSRITYYKRYNTCALLNIVDGSDDDGAAASAIPEQKLSDKQFSTIVALRDAAGIAQADFEARLVEIHDAAEVADLTAKQAATVIHMLQLRIEQGKEK
jgi:hypothetical protein